MADTKKSKETNDVTFSETEDDAHNESTSFETTDNDKLDAMIAQYQKDAFRNEKSRYKKGKKKRR